MREVMDRADRLVRGLGKRPVASTAYATAWAARLRGQDGLLVFPAARQWLGRRQHPDGSWGGAVQAPHDRLVSTLAAITALQDEPQQWARAAVRAGLGYLNARGGRWRQMDGETIGFEVIAPGLLEQARPLGVSLPAGAREELDRIREEKLGRLPRAAAAERPTSLLYSLEVLGNLISSHKAARFASANGSLADSPAATTALWQATGDAAALDYLRQAYDSTGDGGMPEGYPIDVFEPAWVLYLLQRAGLTPPAAGKQVDRLARLAAQAPQGLGFSTAFPVPDSDDTAMVATCCTKPAARTTSCARPCSASRRTPTSAGTPSNAGPQ